ncbi:RmlC-like cupin domain-containing protein [Leucosporidium creatinivorum]|uniref:RmlC-like cupin domain-containing protein n=1 Tax=Leucosporidium creatinivorum TaxID=106004 RepID=A0A1Y2DEJ5_9BASI|nr:RmlC-like cupin domain-containing protein [Leucosporidium creatinivorum]
MRAFDGTPNTECVPHHWDYKTSREVMMRAEGATTTAEAERRALLMINPGIKRAPYTTDTILAAWQLLLPGERALAHRHTVFAMRFFIEGSGGYTAVGGRKMMMEPGDLILTTQFQWHDHGNEGEDACLWLDCLDQPLFAGNFPVNFQMRFMNHPDSNGSRFHESKVWKDMKARLDAKEGSTARLEYTVDSMPEKHASRTMAAYALRINENATTAAIHDTCNHIFHCVSGSGFTIISNPATGEEKKIDWTNKGTWCIPSWHKFTHTAIEGTAYLFTYNDFPTLEKLGFYASAF